MAQENPKQVGATLVTIDAETSYKAKNNDARPKFTGSYRKKKRAADVKVSGGVFSFPVLISVTAWLAAQNVTLFT